MKYNFWLNRKKYSELIKIRFVMAFWLSKLLQIWFSIQP